MSLAGTRSSTEPPRAAEWLRSSARCLLIVLAAGLPFEVPVLTLGPLTITTVELLLYALLALWMLSVVMPVDRHHRRNPLIAAGTLAVRATRRAVGGSPVAATAALWLAIMVIAAIFAPSHRQAAIKFALRAVGGGLLLFAAQDLVRTAADVRRVVAGISWGALFSAAGAIAEATSPRTAPLWHMFHGVTFSVMGLPRPSGPFAYPTIAAMYWEAALPLVVAAPLSLLSSPLSAGRARGWGWTLAAIAGAALLIAAIFLSATRTSLAVCVLVSVALFILTWRHEGELQGVGPRSRQRAATGAVLALVVLLNVFTFASGSAASPLAMRMRWWQDGNWYGAHYTLTPGNLEVEAGSIIAVPVSVQNTGSLLWPQSGPDPVHLSYHWEKTDRTGTHLMFEGRRSRLPYDVPPGGTARLSATVEAPEGPGRYRLRWDLVREHVTWFSQNAVSTGNQDVEVLARAAGSPRRTARTEMADSSLEDWVATGIPSRPVLWGAAVRLWWHHPMLGVGPDNFRHVYPEVLPPLPPERHVRYDDRVHANSLYFETLADLGMSGLLALALFMGAIARTALRRRRPDAGSLLMAAIALALGTFFVHGLLDHFLAFTPTYALMWLLAALLAAPRAAATGRESPPSAASGG